MTSAASAKIRVQDADGTIADAVNTAGTAFALNAAAEVVNGTSYAIGHVLTVTLAADPTIITVGSIAGLQYPATVIDSAGITSGGLAWNISGSTDKLINQ